MNPATGDNEPIAKFEVDLSVQGVNRTVTKFEMNLETGS